VVRGGISENYAAEVGSRLVRFLGNVFHCQLSSFLKKKKKKMKVRSHNRWLKSQKSRLRLRLDENCEKVKEMISFVPTSVVLDSTCVSRQRLYFFSEVSSAKVSGSSEKKKVDPGSFREERYSNRNRLVDWCRKQKRKCSLEADLVHSQKPKHKMFKPGHIVFRLL
jgi:hypothetical protein